VRARLVPEPVDGGAKTAARKTDKQLPPLARSLVSLLLARARGLSLSRDALQISKPLSKQIVVYAKTHPTFSSGVRAFGQIINRMTGICLCVCRTARMAGNRQVERPLCLASVVLVIFPLTLSPHPRSVDAPCCGWVGHQQSHAGTQ
jgi:hypothetical protein